MGKILNCLALTFILFMPACSDNKEPETSILVKDAKILENGEILSPGTLIHLAGNGYLETDKVILNFFWETGDKLIPEGYIKGYLAKIISNSPDGITIQMPYRKPASRVEVNLTRDGKMMNIGNVNLSNGLTPKELKLYGVYNATKIKTSYEKQITRWIDEDYFLGDLESWELDPHPDFHSALGANRAYGICGLSKENDNQYPFFFDFCTQEWNKLSDINTIALFGNGSAIGAIQSGYGNLYEAKIISNNLDRSDDYLSSRSTSPATKFPLPDGVEPEQFGEFPGAYNSRCVLLSANKGNGKWTPVFFSPDYGFAALDEIEAKRLIPFAIHSTAEKKIEWISGFIVVKEESENDCHSFIYGIDDNLTLTEEPMTSFPNEALSATVNHDRPGTLTVHFEGYNSGNVTLDYNFEKQEWTPINEFGSFDEIIWIN